MHRYSDGPGLVGYGPGYRLTDPPGGIGAEFIAPFIVEFLGGSN